MEGKKVTKREVNKVVFILHGSLGQSLRLQVLTNFENIIDNLNRDFDHLLPKKHTLVCRQHTRRCTSYLNSTRNRSI